MPETDLPAIAPANPLVSDPVVEERPSPGGPKESVGPKTDEGPAASNTKGVLRDAIQKVMEEIAYHEQAAKKHLRQADELRKDLRESFAFLQDREGKSKIPALSEENPALPPALAENKDKTKEGAAAEGRSRGNPKKKTGGAKGKGR